MSKSSSTKREKVEEGVGQTKAVGKDKGLFAKYNELLKRHPLAVNSLQAAVIQALSVVASQYLLKAPDSSFDIDYKEVLAMVTVSLTLITPSVMLFYSMLAQWTVHNNIKLVVDQFLFSPVLNFGIIAFRLYLLDMTQPVATILKAALEVTPKAVSSAWIFWVPQRYVGLNYVAADFQMLFTNVCSFVWNIVFAMLMKK